MNQVQDDKNLICLELKNINNQTTHVILRCDAESNFMKGNQHQYYVYILSNKKNGTLYIGITNDLERRIFEHKTKLIGGFSQKYDLNILVYFEQFQNVNDAIKREKQLKNWNRQWKIDLIEKKNMNWIDLASEWTY